MRTGLAIILACIAALGTVATYWGSYTYFRAEELEKAAERMSLYRNTILAELERFSHLTFVLARDPHVIDAAFEVDTAHLDARFKAFADRAGIDAIYLMDMAGMTKAASNAGTPESFIGQDYSFRPYFLQAISGAQGQFYGIGTTTGIPGYFYAEAVKAPDDAMLGVVAIKISLTGLQDSWRQSGENVIVANRDGVVLLSSNPDWRYRTLRPLDPAQRERINAARQFTGQSLEPLDWAPGGEDEATIDEQSHLYLTTDALPNDWSLHYFASDDQAVTRSWLATGTLLLIVGATFIAFQLQRTRRIGAALKRSEQEEALLREANDRLAFEIEERRVAETRLQRTQSELERAGRLAVLGRLSASVTHELGQPIAAMRNHLVAAEMQSGQSVLTDRLQALVDRMEGITRQLKFFARQGNDEVEEVDLRSAAMAALDLLSVNIEEADAEVTTDLPDMPVRVRGSRLRIEQVLTNLLRNALDATAGGTAPQISLTIAQDESSAWVEVADNGHGLGDQTLDDLREPFSSTRASGEGMGLGLTISAGIVEEHGGVMSACNRAQGGAVFRASFPALEGEA
ncbi:sensor histidine kinase [Rhodobacteraceae bacterium NNCM2]|nr:sensor histidine kinase [Coraliihabitans acroporae]